MVLMHESIRSRTCFHITKHALSPRVSEKTYCRKLVSEKPRIPEARFPRRILGPQFREQGLGPPTYALYAKGFWDALGVKKVHNTSTKCQLAKGKREEGG